MELSLERRDLLATLLAGLVPGTALAADELAPAADGVTVRLVVTGHSAQGRSIIVSDKRVGTGALWSALAEQPLGELAPGEKPDPLPATAHIAPKRHGLSVNLAPIMPWRDMQKRFASGGIAGHDQRGFHRTCSIDIVIPLDDGLELLVEEGTAMLKAGDVVIQRNTLHGWRNLGTKPIRLFAVMAGL